MKLTVLNIEKQRCKIYHQQINLHTNKRNKSMYVWKDLKKWWNGVGGHVTRSNALVVTLQTLIFQDFNKSLQIITNTSGRGFTERLKNMRHFEEKLQKCNTKQRQAGPEHLVVFLSSASSLNTNCSVQLMSWGKESRQNFREFKILSVLFG